MVDRRQCEGISLEKKWGKGWRRGGGGGEEEEWGSKDGHVLMLVPSVTKE